MTQLAACPSGAPQISKLSMLARSLNHKLTRLLFGREHEELAYWNGYNMAIDEAVHMAGEETNRVTNFITDHDRFGLDTEKGKSEFIQDFYGVGESQGYYLGGFGAASSVEGKWFVTVLITKPSADECSLNEGARMQRLTSLDYCTTMFGSVSF
jgi:hypothetical protein